MYNKKWFEISELFGFAIKYLIIDSLISLHFRLNSMICAIDQKFK